MISCSIFRGIDTFCDASERSYSSFFCNLLLTQVRSKLLAVKGLGEESDDEDDASKWIEKQRRKVSYYLGFHQIFMSLALALALLS